MKLKFDKNEVEEVIVSADGKSFSSQDYIEMIKQLHSGTVIDVEFGNSITEEEKISVNKMIGEINAVDRKAVTKKVPAPIEKAVVYPDEEINPEDIPF